MEIVTSLHKVSLPTGEELAYRKREGGGERVILVHGNMTSSVHWDVVFEQLDERFTIYAPDLRGFGSSTYRSPVQSIEDFSEDLFHFAEVLDLDSFHLTGWSLGGAVAQHFCINHGEKCQSLYLVASASSRGYPFYKTDEKGQMDTRNRLDTLEEIRNDPRTITIQLAYDNEDYDLLEEIWNTLIYVHRKPDRERYDKYLRDMTTQRNLAETYYALNNFDIRNEIPSISVPVCISRGTDDLVVTGDMTEELKRDYGEKASNVEFASCGHSPLIDAPAELITSMEQFFNKGGRDNG